MSGLARLTISNDWEVVKSERRFTVDLSLAYNRALASVSHLPVAERFDAVVAVLRNQGLCVEIDDEPMGDAS